MYFLRNILNLNGIRKIVTTCTTSCNIMDRNDITKNSYDIFLQLYWISTT